MSKVGTVTEPGPPAGLGRHQCSEELQRWLRPSRGVRGWNSACASPEGRMGRTRDWPAAGTCSARGTTLTWGLARPGVPRVQVAFGEGTGGSRPRGSPDKRAQWGSLGRRSQLALVPKQEVMSRPDPLVGSSLKSLLSGGSSADLRPARYNAGCFHRFTPTSAPDWSRRLD